METFNRPLSDKIDDLISPRDRKVLAVMATTHVVPRAYLWGFADTVRVGLEGREIPQFVLGRVYGFRAPKYFFPVIMAVKLPLGLLVLLPLGLFLFIARRIPLDWNLPAGVVLAVATLFLLILFAGRPMEESAMLCPWSFCFPYLRASAVPWRYPRKRHN